ncbi:uncharacterized protein LOC142980183 [Anticarsia gemmatalis]|uniref:uncharacterized protein LOC142980183 n=1 Tax=Anticarsia gemmatalis TaxID=129554 RepID=UPI003F758D05
MKMLFSFVFTVVIVTTNGQLVPYQEVTCPAKFMFVKGTQSVLVDLDGSTDPDLKTCELKRTALSQSVLLIDGCHTLHNLVLRKYMSNDDPNVIIMTKHLTNNVFTEPLLSKLLRSHRSPVFFIVTDSDTFKCENGTLERREFLKLQSFMNKLWHRYKITHVGVTFPMSCKYKIAVYYGKRNTVNLIYDRTIKLLDIKEINKPIKISETKLTEDYPLRANIFFRFPTSINDCKNLHYYTKINLSLTEGYCGLDALVMHDIVKHFKFKLYFPQDQNCYRYGYEIGNNVTGSLGCIVRKELDISFNSRFMTMYSEDYIFFLHYVAVDSLCAVVKRADVIPVFLYVINVYEFHLWVIIVTVLLTMGICMWVADKFKNKIKTDRKREHWFFYIKDAFLSTLFGFSIEKSGKLYLLRGTCLCCSIMFVAVYQVRKYLFS